MVNNKALMGGSKNNGTPKWMVKIMENPIKHGMIWGGKNPLFLVQHPKKSRIFSSLGGGGWL